MKIKESILRNIIIFLNMMLLGGFLLKAFQVNEINYIYLYISIFIGIIIFEIISWAIQNKNRVRVMVYFILIFIIINYFFNIDYILHVIYVEFFANAKIIANLKYNGYDIRFDLILPYILLCVPIITVLYERLYCFKRNFSIIFNLCVFIILWYQHFYSVVIEYIPLFIFVNMFTYLISGYLNDLKINDDNRALFKVIKKDLIASLLITFLIWLLPKQIYGRNLLGFHDVFYNRYSPKVTKKSLDIDYNTFDLKTVGFSSNNERLGGPIRLSDKKVMLVKSERITYLRGVIKDKYDSRKWVKTNFEYSKMKKENGKYEIPDEKYKDFTFSNIYYMKVLYFDKFNTDALMVPNNITDIVMEGQLLKHEEDEEFLKSEDEKGVYSVYYNELTELGNGNFVDFLDEDAKKSNKLLKYDLAPKKINNVNYKYDEDEWANLSKEAVKQNEIIMSQYYKYLQVPIEVQPKTYELVYRIIKGANNSLEKVERIKEYLRKNYEYSLDVGSVPESQDFVTYFLFNEKKGYCTYYASSMAIMCRIAGIPTRYAEGFKIDKKNSTNTGVYEVKEKNAHAWCEVLVYPESDIWLIVDPLLVEDDLIVENKTKLDEETSDMDDMDFVFERDKKDINKEQNNSIKGYELKNFVAEILILSFIIISLIIAIRIIYTKRMNRIKKNKSIIPLYNHWMYKMTLIGIIKLKEETNYEFLKKIHDEEIKREFKEIMEATNQEYYGNEKNHDIDKEKKYNIIEEYIKNNIGLFRYYLLKIVKLK